MSSHSHFKVEIRIPHSLYVLDRGASEMLLKKLSAFGDDLGEACRKMRDDLRKALLADEAAGPLDGGDDAGGEKIEEETPDIRHPTPDAQDDGTARCAECGYAGDVLALRPGDTEPLFVCHTNGCPRKERPSARTFFTTGMR